MINFVLKHYSYINIGGSVDVEEREYDWEGVSAATREAWGERIWKINEITEGYDTPNFLT
jgi:hypothetical protein